VASVPSTVSANDERLTARSAVLIRANHAALSPAWEGWQRWVKRALDIVVAVVVLIALAPLMAIIAVCIRLDSPGPVIFRQIRCGKNGRLFVFLKFRGMIDSAESLKQQLAEQNEADGPLFKIRNDPRLTRVGRLLRRTSLDELPQLWNVLRGDMSLVGPRPPVPSEVAQYETWQQGRLLVPGGLSGLWQVSGRSELGFTEMVKLDLDYIERWSLWLDLTILARTAAAVLTSRGAY
jgi:exopolysaccharide biosynthesis polyprenyl glycosylphosphotransferase